MAFYLITSLQLHCAGGSGGMIGGMSWHQRSTGWVSPDLSKMSL